MNNFKPIRKAFISCLLAVYLVAVYSVNVSAYSLQGIKWPSSSISYKVDSSVPFSGYSGAISQSISWWNNKTDAYLYNSSSSTCTVYAYNYGYTSWDGNTTLYSSGGIVNKGTLQLNRYWTDSYARNNQLELNLVTAHEFGHVLGLGHVFSYQLMYINDVWTSYLNNSSLAYGPTYDDVSGVNYLY